MISKFAAEAAEMTGRMAVIVGPTAAGKSALAEALVQPLDAEIISADALQAYRGFDIGTAKPSPTARSRFRYHCVDVLPADRSFSAGEFASLARPAIEDVLSRGRKALVVGGSGFYIDVMLGLMDSLPASDRRWRAALESVAARRSVEALHGWLQRLDAERAKQIDPGDRQRLVRALEIVLRTGRPIESAAAGRRVGPGATPARPATLGLAWPREELRARIAARVDEMLARGWLQEVEGLIAVGVTPEAHAMQAIGYRELHRVVLGELTLDAARARIVAGTRRYARRQMSYFRRWPVTWLKLNEERDAAHPDTIRSAIEALAP